MMTQLISPDFFVIKNSAAMSFLVKIFKGIRKFGDALKK